MSDLDVPQPVGPDFLRLFPVCRRGTESCRMCSGSQLTPRTAAALWSAARLLSDGGYEDVIEHGDDPMLDDGDWSLFNDYPKLTWSEDAVWRRQAARSYNDLAGDLEAGGWPRPGCAGEETALHLILRYASAAVHDGWSGLESTFADLLRETGADPSGDDRHRVQRPGRDHCRRPPCTRLGSTGRAEVVSC